MTGWADPTSDPLADVGSFVSLYGKLSEHDGLGMPERFYCSTATLERLADPTTPNEWGTVQDPGFMGVPVEVDDTMPIDHVDVLKDGQRSVLFRGS